MTTRKKSARGFASISPERRREIASKGGKAAHEQGKAHRFTPEEARAAGVKGGAANAAKGAAHMAMLGRKGARKRWTRSASPPEPGDDTLDGNMPAVNTLPPPPADN